MDAFFYSRDYRVCIRKVCTIRWLPIRPGELRTALFYSERVNAQFLLFEMERELKLMARSFWNRSFIWSRLGLPCVPNTRSMSNRSVASHGGPFTICFV